MSKDDDYERRNHHLFNRGMYNFTPEQIKILSDQMKFLKKQKEKSTKKFVKGGVVRRNKKTKFF